MCVARKVRSWRSTLISLANSAAALAVTRRTQSTSAPLQRCRCSASMSTPVTEISTKASAAATGVIGKPRYTPTSTVAAHAVCMFMLLLPCIPADSPLRWHDCQCGRSGTGRRPVWETLRCSRERGRSHRSRHAVVTHSVFNQCCTHDRGHLQISRPEVAHRPCSRHSSSAHSPAASASSSVVRSIGSACPISTYNIG